MAMEQARRDLQDRLEELLGKEHALTLMAALPPSEAATKADIEALRLSTQGDVENLRTDLRAEMRDMEARLIERVDLKIESSENRVIAAFRKELVAQTRVFVFSTLTSVVTVGGLAVAAGRFG